MIPVEAKEVCNAEDAPGSGSYIYFLIMDGVCVYVGQTTNLRKRLVRHKDKTYTAVKYIHVEDDVRMEMEHDFIKRISPQYNKNLRGDGRTASIYVRLAPSERAAIDEASGGNPTIWAREVLLRAARRKK